jgi:hypothetical protein
MTSRVRWLRISPRIAAYLLAAAMAAALADSLLRIPVQVSDSLDAIVEAATAESTLQLVAGTSRRSSTTFRPMRHLQVRALIAIAEWSGLSYSTVLRGLHAALIAAILLLFVAAVRVETWLDAAALVLPLTALVGLHTFVGQLREAYPVNHFAQVTAASLAVFVLGRGRPRPLVCVATVLLVAYSLALVEAGVLVWVTAVACVGAGFPGHTRATVVATTLVLALYAGGRVALDIGTPSIGSHGTGFGAESFSADAIAERFGRAPGSLIAYNVAGAALSVLASEPRGGAYQLLRPRLAPVVAINVISSLALTVLVAWSARAAWRRRRQLTNDDRLVAVALVVIVANALVCATYIKDEVLGVAGAFYALAACAALRAFLPAAARVPRPAVALVLAIGLAATASLWAFRALGVHYQLRYAAFITRNDWVRVLPPHDRGDWPEDPRALAITRALKNEAIQRPTASSRFLPRWGDAYWVP